MVHREQSKGLDELGLDSRSPDGYQRLTGKHRRTLGNGIDVAGKSKILQIGQKLLVKEIPAPEIVDVLLGEMEVFNIVDELIQARSDGEAAAVRHSAEKHIEIGDAILVAVFEISITHGQLIKITEHGHVQLFLRFHPHTSKFLMYLPLVLIVYLFCTFLATQKERVVKLHALFRQYFTLARQIRIHSWS